MQHLGVIVFKQMYTVMHTHVTTKITKMNSGYFKTCRYTLQVRFFSWIQYFLYIFIVLPQGIFRRVQSPASFSPAQTVPSVHFSLLKMHPAHFRVLEFMNGSLNRLHIINENMFLRMIYIYAIVLTVSLVQTVLCNLLSMFHGKQNQKNGKLKAIPGKHLQKKTARNSCSSINMNNISRFTFSIVSSFFCFVSHSRTLWLLMRSPGRENKIQSCKLSKIFYK